MFVIIYLVLYHVINTL